MLSDLCLFWVVFVGVSGVGILGGSICVLGRVCMMMWWFFCSYFVIVVLMLVGVSWV